jgi:hypothetical protein
MDFSKKITKTLMSIGGQLKCAVYQHTVDKGDVLLLYDKRFDEQPFVKTTCPRCNYPLRLEIDERDRRRYKVFHGLD